MRDKRKERKCVESQEVQQQETEGAYLCLNYCRSALVGKHCRRKLRVETSRQPHNRTHHNTQNCTHRLGWYSIETRRLALLEWQGMQCSYNIPCHEISHECSPLQLDVLLLLPGMTEDGDIDDDDECDTPPLPCLHDASSSDEGVDMIGLSCMQFMLSALSDVQPV